jgi:hypothetical protein
MLSLPEFHGRFPVGATTFKFPVCTKVLGTAKIHRHGHSDDGPSVKPALQLDEVVFTAYYPAHVKGSNIKKGMDWLLRSVLMLVRCRQVKLTVLVRFGHLYMGMLIIQAGVVACLV